MLQALNNVFSKINVSSTEQCVFEDKCSKRWAMCFRREMFQALSNVFSKIMFQALNNVFSKINVLSAEQCVFEEQNL